MIVAYLVLPSSANGCQMNDKECVFRFQVESKLTMMDDKTLVYPANGNIYKYDVTNTSSAEPVSPERVITADGWEEPRIVTVVNGMFPGPDIIVYEGQTIIVEVKNMLESQSVTIHWHGLQQRDTPWMDGVPYVTQCPIQPYQTFVYRFKAEPREHSGGILTSEHSGQWEFPVHLLLKTDIRLV